MFNNLLHSLFIGLLFVPNFLWAQTTCTISSGSVSASTLNATCPSGFTNLVITGNSTTLNINSAYTNLNLIELSIEGGAVMSWSANVAFTMSASGNLYLNKNGGGSVPTGSPCNTNQDLFFGTIEVANCPGSNGVSSFAQITSAGGASAAGPLPVELLYFKSNGFSSNGAILNWATASEINNSHFEVQRSLDLVNFENIGTVTGKGNSQEIVTYEFVDNTIPKATLVYYRLNQVDFDGKSEFSSVIKISNATEIADNGIALFPNPAQHTVTITGLQNPEFENVEIQIVDLAGRVLKEKSIYLPAEKEDLEIMDLPSGSYFVIVTGANVSQSIRIAKI